MTTMRCDRLDGNATTPCWGEIGLFRFYNKRLDKFGEPFAICERHKKQQVIPDECWLDELETEDECETET